MRWMSRSARAALPIEATGSSTQSCQIWRPRPRRSPALADEQPLVPAGSRPRSRRRAFLMINAEEAASPATVVIRRHERLFICRGRRSRGWAANIWHDCVELPVASIGSAARALRDIQRNWAMYAPLHHRRAALVEERLPHISAKPVVFPAAAPTAPLGSWTLLAPDRLLAAGRCSLPLPTARLPSSRTRPGPQPRLSQAVGGAGAARALAGRRRTPASTSAHRRAAGLMSWPASVPM